MLQPLVRRVSRLDAKLVAATQAIDEARHVEVFSRYLEEKLGGKYQICRPLQDLMNAIISDGRWDIIYLGMQIMVEGLALATFGLLQRLTSEPLLKSMLRLVMADESRHVAFGMLSLGSFYGELSDGEIRERQSFAL